MNRSLALTGLLLLVGTLILPPQLSAADPAPWPQWRGPTRNGIVRETGLLPDWNKRKPELLWMAEGMGNGYASLSIAEGKIYTSGNMEEGQAIVAVDQADGQLIWKTFVTATPPKHGYEGSRTTPTYDEGFLYAVPSDGQIVCLKASDGSIVWKKDFKQEYDGKMMSGWGFSESPLVDGDRVLFTPGGSEATIVCLDKRSGDEIWRSAVPSVIDNGKNHHESDNLKKGAGYASIGISHGGGVKQYVQVLGQGIVSVRASDGKYLWGYEEASNKTANIPDPILFDDYVFCSSGYKTGAALLKLSADGDGVKATEEYFVEPRELQNHHGGMVKIGNLVFTGHGHGLGQPTCVDWKTGEIVWKADDRGPGSGSAAVIAVDGNLIFRYQDGTVALIGAGGDEYVVKGTFEPEYQEGKTWAHPVVVDGKLYLREQDKLMCYDLRRD